MAAHLDHQQLRFAPWLQTTAIRRVFAALATTGATSRAVGGAVRNTLLGQPIDDVDIATTAKPEAVIAAAKAAGLHAVPTGLQHGTVTLVADGQPFEVTTLRRDVATDGRHAIVAFTDDWALDASRRDFTINALYCDSNGHLFDPLGGSVDLHPPRIRFIGDARARIREDYLRILRFFRFSARFGDGNADQIGLDACATERGGFSRVSAERVRVELLKLLVAPHAAQMCRTMQAYGFLVRILGTAPSIQRLQRLAAIESALNVPPDPIRRLAALALAPMGDANALARRLRLSGNERNRLKTIVAEWAHLLAAQTDADVRRCIYRRQSSGFSDAIFVAWAGSAADASDVTWRHRVAIASTWAPPKLPITGQDILALGGVAGPQVGTLLQSIEAWWLANDFAPNRAACLRELAEIADVSDMTP